MENLPGLIIIGIILVSLTGLLAMLAIRRNQENRGTSESSENQAALRGALEEWAGQKQKVRNAMKRSFRDQE